MGLYKLREWVGTVTGKGDRWGRDSVGRSAPTFMAASTTALPPLTCTAGRRWSGSCCYCCEAGHLWPCVLRPVPGGESAGCVRLQWLVQQAFCCLPPLCLPCPLPFISSCPRSFAPFSLLAPVHFAPLCCAPVPCHVRQAHRRFRASSLLSGPAVCQLQKLSRWQLQHGPAVAARAPVHLNC